MSQPPKGHRSKYGSASEPSGLLQRSPHSPTQAVAPPRSGAVRANVLPSSKEEKKSGTVPPSYPPPSAPTGGVSAGEVSSARSSDTAVDTAKGATPRGITVDRAVVSVCRLLETLELPEVALALRARFKSQGRDDTSEAEAWRNFAAALTKQFSQAYPSSPRSGGGSASPHGPADPSTEWSRDAVEKSVVPMVQTILETDKYIPRHVIKSITQRMNSQATTASASSSRQVVTPSTGLDRAQAYPRYRAPIALGRSGRSRCTFPAPTSLTAATAPPSPTASSTGGDHAGAATTSKQLTPDGSVGRSSGTGASRKTHSHPAVALLGASEGLARKCPSLRPFSECKPSEVYFGRVAGAPTDDDPFAKDDEYRDDDDPGHRIRELWEAELVEEVRARERQNSEAQRIPFFAAFVPTYTTPSSRRDDSVRGRSPIGSEPRLTYQQPAQLPQDRPLGSSPLLLETGSPLGSARGVIVASGGGGSRRASVSSQSTNSLYALNSTPPPHARGATRQQQTSAVGRPADDSPFSSRRSETPTKSVTDESSSQQQSASNRCHSPTFGSPTNRSPDRKGDPDSAVTLTSDQQSTTVLSGGGGSSFGTNTLYDVTSDGGGDFTGSRIFDKVIAKGNSPALKPSGTLEDELAYCTSETAKSTSVTTAPPQRGGERFGSVSDPSKDSLESRLAHLTDSGPFEDFVSLYFAYHPGAKARSRDQGERWSRVYCDGDSEQFRRKKREERIVKQASLLSPDSGDSTYPLIEDTGKVVDCFNLKVIFERDKTGFEESKEFPVNIGTTIAGRYVIESQLGQAAFSKALRCYDKMAKRHVCMKVIRNEKDYVDQCLDEIKLLRYINCNGDVDLVHCLRLLDFCYYKEHLIIVTELLKENLYEFSLKCRKAGEDYFTMGKIQRVAYQTLVALEYIHSLRLIHSDLKPENILIKNEATCEIKVIDFGSSCYEDDVLSLYVQSRSYRAPEVLLGLPYDQKIDIWSLGCIVAELWTGYVLFQNDSTTALLARIVGILGRIPYYMICKGQAVSEYFTQDGQLFQFVKDTPTVSVCPERGRRIRILLPKKSNIRQRMRTTDEGFMSFLSMLLQIDPSKRWVLVRSSDKWVVYRPSAMEALEHPWLKSGRYTDGL